MATKAQILKRKHLEIAKTREESIRNKYNKYIPDLQRSGNVISIFDRVSKYLTESNRRTKSTNKGKRERCGHSCPINYMEGDLVKMGRR